MKRPAVVDELVAAYLEAVDGEVGGLVEGFYLVGSAAPGDFRPHRSDIDFVLADQAGSGPVSAVAAGATEYLRLPGRQQRRPLYRTPLARRRDLLDFGDMVIADAHRLHNGYPAAPPHRPRTSWPLVRQPMWRSSRSRPALTLRCRPAGSGG